MASNLISRLLPSAGDDDSAIPHRHISHGSDTDETNDMAIDEENFGERFQDQDLDQLLAEAAGSDIATEKSMSPIQAQPRRAAGNVPSRTTPKWMRNSLRTAVPRPDEDDDVPESLMLENQKGVSPMLERIHRRAANSTLYELPPPTPGPATGNTRAQWESTRRQQQLHGHEDRLPPVNHSRRTGRGVVGGSVIADPKEQAMWRWANVENLDNFLTDVYSYYEHKGIWSILLHKGLALLTVAFMIFFLTFTSFCIDYSKLSQARNLNDIRVPHCAKNLNWFVSLLLWIVSAVWILYCFNLARELSRLWDMHNFYHHLLGIPDKDIQTVTWQYVVRCLMALRDHNPMTADRDALSAENRRWLKGQSKQRMDAHDIANRLMRKENYWISIINRDILDCSITLPLLGKRQFYTKSIEWNLDVAVTQFVFNQNGQIKDSFLHSKNRTRLVNELKGRFRQVALINLLVSIPLAIWFIVSRVLTFFMEYKSNPTSAGSREWTPIVSWKLREFNEVGHLFRRRKLMARHFADGYLEQFPRDKTAQAARFVTFVTGAMLAVLGFITLFDNELFLGFEIGGKTVVFWFGTLGAIWNMARGLIPPDDAVYDPEMWIERVIECTHYKPKAWEGKLYSDEVLKDFSSIYKLELVLWFEELASVLFGTWMFWYQLPNCAENLVDFFREFTIHVDGLGHVCSFAVFDFKSNNQANQRLVQDNPNIRGEFGTRDNKLAESYQTFMMDYAGDAPRKGLGRERGKRNQFHLPPVFPGLAASRLQNLATSMHYTPRMAPAVATGQAASPMHSILLDAHHQPRNSPRTTPQVRHRGAATSRYQGVDADPDEHEEDLLGLPAKPATLQRTPSKILEEDSDLGDSWAVRGDAGVTSGSGSKDKDDEGVGVLGLLYQFQKAQTEGRGLNN